MSSLPESKGKVKRNRVVMITLLPWVYLKRAPTENCYFTYTVIMIGHNNKKYQGITSNKIKSVRMHTYHDTYHEE